MSLLLTFVIGAGELKDRDILSVSDQQVPFIDDELGVQSHVIVKLSQAQAIPLDIFEIPRKIVAQPRAPQIFNLQDWDFIRWIRVKSVPDLQIIKRIMIKNSRITN